MKRLIVFIGNNESELFSTSTLSDETLSDPTSEGHCRRLESVTPVTISAVTACYFYQTLISATKGQGSEVK